MPIDGKKQPKATTALPLLCTQSFNKVYQGQKGPAWRD